MDYYIKRYTLIDRIFRSFKRYRIVEEYIMNGKKGLVEEHFKIQVRNWLFGRWRDYKSMYSYNNVWHGNAPSSQYKTIHFGVLKFRKYEDIKKYLHEQVIGDFYYEYKGEFIYTLPSGKNKPNEFHYLVSLNADKVGYHCMITHQYYRWFHTKEEAEEYIDENLRISYIKLLKSNN